MSDADEIMRIWRSAPERLVPALLTLAGDDHDGVRQYALRSVAAAGRATALVADRLVDLLEGTAPAAAPGFAPAARWSALSGLARLGDARCGPVLRMAAARPPDEFRGLADALAGMAAHAGELVPAVREGLRPYRDGAVTPDTPAPYRLLAGIQGWGAARHDLSDDLLGLTKVPAWRTHPGDLPRIIGLLGSPGLAALPYLVALRDHEQPEIRVEAAVADWRLTGNGEGAVAVLRRVLREEAGTVAIKLVAGATRVLGTAAAALAPDLAVLLGHDDDPVPVRAACALWFVTHDADRVLPVLLAGAAPDRPGIEAVEVLTEIGPTAPELRPVLDPMANSDRRIPDCTGDACMLTDERYQQVARKALAAIRC